MLGSHPAEGLACLLRAEDLARQINDPVADTIRDVVHGMRANHLSVEALPARWRPLEAAPKP